MQALGQPLQGLYGTYGHCPGDARTVWSGAPQLGEDHLAHVDRGREDREVWISEWLDVQVRVIAN
jgi:hypothetical protein